MNLTPEPTALAYAIDPGPTVRWDTTPVSADVDHCFGDSTSPNFAQDNATHFLQAQLATGPKPAAEILHAFGKRSGNHIEALQRLARVYLSCEQFGRCQATLSKLVKLDPANAVDYLNQTAIVALERRQPHEAQAALAQLVSISGEDALVDEFSAGVLDMILDAGVDVLIGVDPVQGKGTGLAEMKRRTRGRMCLWGGVNGFLTVERGTSEEIRAAVAAALEALGPDGLILSPVDNVRDESDRTWRNTEALIDTWRSARAP